MVNIIIENALKFASNKVKRFFKNSSFYNKLEIEVSELIEKYSDEEKYYLDRINEVEAVLGSFLYKSIDSPKLICEEARNQALQQYKEQFKDEKGFNQEQFDNTVRSFLDEISKIICELQLAALNPNMKPLAKQNDAIFEQISELNAKFEKIPKALEKNPTYTISECKLNQQNYVDCSKPPICNETHKVEAKNRGVKSKSKRSSKTKKTFIVITSTFSAIIIVFSSIFFPVYFIGLRVTIVSVSTGYSHSMALDKRGRIWTWGTGTFGELGHGGSMTEFNPTRIEAGFNDAELPLFTKINAGSRNSMALDTDGKIWSWGNNNFGQLGHGNRSNASRPQKIESTTIFTAISSRFQHSMALDEEGNIWSWGNGGHGRLGNGLTRYMVGNRVPLDVSSPLKLDKGFEYIDLPTFAKISAGGEHSIALDEEGNIWTWGRNSEGQLGHGNNEDENRPRRIESGFNYVELPSFVKINAGGANSSAIDDQGRIWTWGRGNDGHLGHGTTIENRPRMVERGRSGAGFGNVDLPGFVATSLATRVSIVLDEQGKIWSSGGGFSSSSFSISGIAPTNIVAICFRWNHGLALDNENRVWVWGNNFYGQLANGDVDERANVSFRARRINAGSFRR